MYREEESRIRQEAQLVEKQCSAICEELREKLLKEVVTGLVQEVANQEMKLVIFTYVQIVTTTCLSTKKYYQTILTNACIKKKNNT